MKQKRLYRIYNLLGFTVPKVEKKKKKKKTRRFYWNSIPTAARLLAIGNTCFIEPAYAITAV